MSDSSRRLVLVWTVLVLAVATFLAYRAARRAQSPTMLVIVVDTLRADRLGCAGYERSTSPNLDRLAAEGLFFERAYAPSSWTLPSVASMFTGRLPAEHGVQGWSDSLPGGTDVAVLAEELGRRGYVSTAVIGNANVNIDAGFGRGFDVVFEARTEPRLAATGLSLYPTARDMTDLAIELLDELADRQFFLYLHYMDTHAPYVLPDGAEDLYADPAYDGYMVTELEAIRPLVGPRYMRVYPYFWSKFRDVPEDQRRVRDLYDAKVHYADQHIGRLLDHLDGLGLGDTTLVVVTSDHGEGLFQHGIREHEDVPYEHQVRVPLIARGPGLEAGSVTEVPVELLDLPLALTEVAGGRWPDPTAGGNGVLRGALNGRDLPGSGLAFANVHIAERFEEVQMVVQDDRKMIRTEHEKLVFDLAADPGELTNLVGQDPTTDTLLEALIEQRLGPLGAAPRDPTEITDPEVLERLRALGYVE